MDYEVIKRRLLLAKEFYLHAAERSRHMDAVNKMMAVHNFHIAVEVVLRAVILKYEIRTEKELNIDFASMMKDIDKHAPARLLFRQDLVKLNTVRALVQHHAMEPDQTSIEEFRAIVKRFLEESYEAYFGLSFTELSRIALISDPQLRNLLIFSQELAEKGDALEAASRVIAAFWFALQSVVGFLPDEGFYPDFFVSSRFKKGIGGIDEIINGFEEVFSRVREAEKLAAILGSGVSLSSLKRFKSIPVSVDFSVNGTPLVQAAGGVTIDLAEVAWAVDFVTSCILMWEQHGLEPKVRSDLVDGALALLEEEVISQGR